MKWAGREVILVLILLIGLAWVGGADIELKEQQKESGEDAKYYPEPLSTTTFIKSDASTARTPPETTTITAKISTESSSSKMTSVDEILDPCLSDPCENGGTCEKRDRNTFACICVKGYTGDRCDEIEWCKRNQETVCGKEECRFDVQRSSGYCYCGNDSYFDAKHKTCQKMDECMKRRLNGECSMPFETCDEGQCKCIENYEYSTNRTSCKPAFCKSSPCGRNMNCEEADGSYICFCEDHYHQVGKDCIKYDVCSPGQSKCAQKCRTNGTCECYAGYTTTDGGATCEPVKAVQCSLDCGKGSCAVNGKQCICPQISHVVKNRTCIDKCSAGVLNKYECPEGVNCKPDDTLGYRCDCKGKYKFAQDDVHCELKSMCSEGGGEAICAAKNALCLEDFNNADGYVCQCEEGQDKEPGTGVCKNKCELKQKECLENQAVCMLDVKNNAVCICPPLLTKGMDGKCNKLATYSYTGDFMVEKERYQMGERKRRTKRSVEDIDYAKLQKDFDEAMSRIFEGYKDSAILNCLDTQDHWKCSMEIKLDNYPGEKIHILSTPTMCLPMSDDSHCVILPNFVTKPEKEMFRKSYPCQKEMTRILCGQATECSVLKESTIAFECKCKPGYYARTSYRPAVDASVEICEDIDECSDLSKCPNTTDCINIPGDYSCPCKDGHVLDEGKSSKKDGCREVCRPNPCVHGTCTQSGKDGFSCNCEDGFYTGLFCNETNGALTAAKKAGRYNISVIAAVLGTFLAVSVIICLLLVRKIIKQNSKDDNEEYARQRQRGIVSQMRNNARRVPDREEDVEVRDTGRRPGRQPSEERESGDYRREPADSLSIPRPHLGHTSDRTSGGRPLPGMRDSGGYRRGFSDDDRMYSKAPSSRRSEEDSHPNQGSEEREQPMRRPLSRSSDPFDNDIRNGRKNTIQYRNRGYEEE